MSTFPAWTPAPQPGLIPLYPMTFGQILGRTFAALRHNPRVLLGFAVGVQAVVSTAGYVAMAFALVWLMQRVETVDPTSADAQAIATGSTVAVFLVTLAINLVLQCLTVVVQGIVAADVAAGAVGEKPALRQLWSTVRPAVGRLLGYTLQLTLAVLIALAVPGALIVWLIATGGAAMAIGIVLLVLLVLAGIAGSLWLTVKLLFVPAVIVLERGSIRASVARSWSLTRGRFWVALGITVVINLAFSIVGSTVGFIVQLITMLLSTSVSPLGSTEDLQGVIDMLTLSIPGTVVQLVIASVGTIVVATAATILYIDARMRREGLDIDLLGYVERRDAGGDVTADPYAFDPARVHSPTAARGVPFGYGPPLPGPGGGQPTPPPGFATSNITPPSAAPTSPQYGEYAPPRQHPTAQQQPYAPPQGSPTPPPVTPPHVHPPTDADRDPR